MFKSIGPTELIIIGVILILIFGSKKISEIAHDLGETSKELKKVKKEMDDNSYKEALTDLPVTKKDTKEVSNSV